jgi:hypothetical protein
MPVPAMDLTYVSGVPQEIESIGLLVACALMALPLVLLLVLRPTNRTEERVASALGLKRGSRHRLFGRFQTRQIEVRRRGMARLIRFKRSMDCQLTVSLSPAWRTHPLPRNSDLEAELKAFLRHHPDAWIDGDRVVCLEEDWPLYDGEYWGRERLQAMLQGACIVAAALDQILEGAAADAVGEKARRETAFLKLGLVADGPDAWVGAPEGCEVRLERRGERCVLFAPLGPGWPPELTIVRNGHENIARDFREGRLLECVKAPLAAYSREPERARRLFSYAGPEFHEALRSVFFRFPDPSIVHSWLGLHFGAWDMRPDQVPGFLAPVCRFLKEVYRCTDWPQKRDAAAARRAEELRAVPPA